MLKIYQFFCFRYFNFEDSWLSSEELKQGKQVISEFVNIFSMDDLDVGHTTAVRHHT